MSSMQTPSETFGELLLMFLQEKKKEFLGENPQACLALRCVNVDMSMLRYGKWTWGWVCVTACLLRCVWCGRPERCSAEETVPIDTQKDTGVLLLEEGGPQRGQSLSQPISHPGPSEALQLLCTQR